jgi:predicted component of type VI protein secretion system
MGMKKICLIAALATLYLGTGTSAPQEVDRLLAAVNGKVITELDLKMTRWLNAVLDVGQSKQLQSRKEELEQLIDLELVRQEMENYPIPQAQVDAVVNAKVDFLRDTYAEIGGLPALLGQLGLEMDELIQKIRVIVKTDRFIATRFLPFVNVSSADVENYYQLKLIPDLKARGYPASSLADVASKIEALLIEEKKSAAWFQWFENLKKNSRIERFSNDGSPAEKKLP